MIGLNIGSGQRRFDTSNGWVNIDCVSRPNEVPDMICDVGKEPLPYEDNTVDYCVLHHVYEHFGNAAGMGLVKECHRVLKPGGSLIITIPDMRALAERWLAHQIPDFIYMINIYGAYHGEEGDFHRWGFTRSSLSEELQKTADWSMTINFDWRDIPGSSIARDWWILGLEVIK